MATAQPVVKFTYEDYRATPEDERYELLCGDLIMVPAPNIKHQRVQARLHYRLTQFILDHEPGELLLAPCDVVLSRHRRRTAGPAVRLPGTGASAERGENVQGAPDLVIEIPSADRALAGIEWCGRGDLNPHEPLAR